MINVFMREFNYFLYGEKNAYGQPQLSKDPQGTIKMAIYESVQRVTDNALYSEAEFIGLTRAEVDDSFVIERENGERLKVLYVVPKGRLKQVYLQRM